MESIMKKVDFKRCSKCGEEKPASAEYFVRAKKEKSGLASSCKDCNRKWREQNREKLLAASKKWRQENKKKKAEMDKRYREKNKEKRAAYDKEYNKLNSKKKREYYKLYREKNGDAIREKHRIRYHENKEEINEKKRKYYRENREAIIERRKPYREKTREQSRKRAKEYYRKVMLDPELREKRKKQNKDNHRQRYRKDPIYRLLSNIRGGLWSCVRGRTKTSSSLDYVGLTSEELMEHLEVKFTEGMTRENYGKWHVDHIRPLASFDFTAPDKEEQLYKAWDYTNLQPLWASENQSKGAKYEEG